MPPKKKTATTATAANSSAATAGSSATAGKKRGRPSKASVAEDEPPAKRSRVASKASTAKEAKTPDEKKAAFEAAKPARGPGRPRKSDSAAAAKPTETPKKRGRPPKKTESTDEDVPEKTTSKKRGRPAKKTEPSDEESPEEATSKKRGQPAKGKTDAAKVAEELATPRKKRGRFPKGGETTQIVEDDAAAAEQLGDDLKESAAETKTESKATSSKKGKANSAKVDVADSDAPAASGSGKQYWLMKAEQEDREEIMKDGSTFNTKFTIDDLINKGGPEPWDGVRNPVAAKNMRAMKKGDLAFFYASGGKAGRKPGITGIMEVVKEHEPDVTVSDKSAYGYVEKEADRNKWCVVHVEFRKKLNKPVHLSELQKYGQNNGVLSNMDLLRLTRLSVSEVSESEWNFINENLIEGFEKESDGPGDNGALTSTISAVGSAATEVAGVISSALTGVAQTVSHILG